MKHKELAVTGILAAILCVFAPFSLPLGAIPLSFATLAVFLISCLATPTKCVAAVIIYILFGAAGIPVFSGFTGGFQQIAGLTGGYIIGYIPCAFIVSLLINKFPDKKSLYPVSMMIGTVICYILGTAWYSLQTATDFWASLAVCVLPFVIGDTIKIILASVLGITLRKRLSKYIKNQR